MNIPDQCIALVYLRGLREKKVADILNGLNRRQAKLVSTKRPYTLKKEMETRSNKDRRTVDSLEQWIKSSLRKFVNFYRAP